MIAAALASLAVSAAVPAAPAVLTPDQPRYALSVRWTPATATLAGSERVTFHNNGTTSLAFVWLRFWPNGWHPVGTTNGATGCARPRATLRVLFGGRLGRRAVSCTAYRVDLKTPLAPGASGSVRVSFAVRVPYADDRFGTVGGITFLGNAIPILSVREAGTWHLPPYSANGESFFSLAATWDARITVPHGYQVASTGTGPMTRDVWHVKATNARDFALAVGRLQIDQAAVAGVRVRVLTPPGTARATRRSVAAWSRAAIERYTALWGAYGSPELDVVTGAFTSFGGMEYPELVFTDPFQAPVVHEVAHQWFYRMVGDDQWASPWLDESFASYAERLLSPGAPCPVPPVPHVAFLDDSMAVFDASPDAYYPVVYLGGACALEDLERGLGATTFATFLRAWVADHRFGVATTAEFVAAVRAAAPPAFDVDAWLRIVRIRTA